MWTVFFKRRGLWAVLLPIAVVGLAVAATPRLELQGSGALRWNAPAPPILLRSTTRPSLWRGERLPLRSLALKSSSGTWTDPGRADGVTYYYRLRTGTTLSEPLQVVVPNRPLPSLQQPEILVDKLNYYLELRDGGRPVKRYPIAMGKLPAHRKLCYDNASTPEGRYRIVNLQPQATYYRAFDLDYPNAVDQLRYDFFQHNGLLQGDPGIGSEIQIHGKGIAVNWTFGCVALRNEDMDELFSHPEIAVGTPVTIVGQELTRDDLQAIDRADSDQVGRALRRVLGPRAGFDASSLGLFQLKKGLPVTCQADRRTLRALHLGHGAGH